MPFDIFDTYYMAGMVQEIVPVQSFFRDRYFPTNAATDIFNANKVLVEYRDRDRAMAPFVVRRAGDIPVARGGYEIHEFEPPFTAPSRLLTMDDLQKRGFGEALYAGSTPPSAPGRSRCRTSPTWTAAFSAVRSGWPSRP